MKKIYWKILVVTYIFLFFKNKFYFFHFQILKEKFFSLETKSTINNIN